MIYTKNCIGVTLREVANSMKRLIAAVLTATAMLLVSCSAASEGGPTPTAASMPGSAPTASQGQGASTSTAGPVQSWLSGDPTVSTSTEGSQSAQNGEPPTTSQGESPTGAASDSYDAIPVTVPDSIAGDDLEAAHAAILVWRNAIRVIDESLEGPSGQDWQSSIYRYVSDPAALTQMSLIDTFAKQGIHQVGEIGYTAAVLNAAQHNVQIRACVDMSHYDVVDTQGDSALQQGSPTRFARTYSISYYGDQNPARWLLNNIKTPSPVEPC